MNEPIYSSGQKLKRDLFYLIISITISFTILILFILLIINSGTAAIIIAACLLFLLISCEFFIFLGVRMSVTIDYESLNIELFPLAPLNIPIEDISKAEEILFNPMTDFGGYGRRASRLRKETGYILNGKTGVRVYWTGSMPVVIGTDKPEEFIAAIQYSQQRRKILAGRK